MNVRTTFACLPVLALATSWGCASTERREAPEPAPDAGAPQADTQAPAPEVAQADTAAPTPETAQADAGPTVPEPSVPTAGLTVVDAPAGETIAATKAAIGELFADEGKKPETFRVGGKSITVQVDGDPFLTAKAGGKTIWTIDAVSAGGADPSFLGNLKLPIFFVEQNRVGLVAVDVQTGKTLMGYDAIAVAPDAKWAILTPLYSLFTMCASDAKFARLELKSPLATRPLPIVPLPAVLTCDAPNRDDAPSVVPWGDVAIAPKGDLYAAVQGLRGLDGTIAPGAKLIVEVFRASDDVRVGSTTLPYAAPSTIAFSASGKFVVLTVRDDAGKETRTWLRLGAP